MDLYKVHYSDYFSDHGTEHHFMVNDGYFIVWAESLEHAIDLVKRQLTNFMGDTIVITKAKLERLIGKENE